MNQFEEQLYSKKFYNVKILKTYVSYLKAKCGWGLEKIERLFDRCDLDVTFLDADDNWFDQALADRFIDVAEKMTGDDNIAYKVGQFTFSPYAMGIQGRLMQGLVSPQFIFNNIGKYSMAYSRGASLQTVQSGPASVVLRSSVVDGCEEKPYQCQNRMGMLEAIPPFFGRIHTKIGENKCVHRGDPYCEYLITWENPVKLPESMTPPLIGLLSLGISYIVTGNPIFALSTGFKVGLCAYLFFVYQTFKRLKTLVTEKDGALDEAVRIFHRRYEETTLKHKIVFETFQTKSVDQLSQHAAEAIKQAMKYDRVLIMMVDQEHNVLKTTGAVGFEGNLKEIIEMAEFSIDPENTMGFLIRVLNSKTPLFIRDAKKKMENLSKRSQRLLKLLETEAFIAVPIISGKNAVGVLAVESTDKEKPLVNDDMELLTEISKFMGLAVYNIKNFQTIKRSEKLAKALEEQERHLRLTFQKFIPEEVASRLRHFGDAFLSVQKKTVDVMFVDVMDFTTLSENCAPEEVVDILNIYIHEVQTTVDRYNGKINKIIGDGLLIYFDEMGPNVLLAGYAILQACQLINAKLAAKGYAPISIGIGAHRGVCTIGYIGTGERLDYTLIGDTVNVASRIQTYTRKVGANVFCFSSTLIDEAAGLEYVSRGKEKLKGKKKSVEIFQLLKLKEASRLEMAKTVFYRKGKTDPIPTGPQRVLEWNLEPKGEAVENHLN